MKSGIPCRFAVCALVLSVSEAFASFPVSFTNEEAVLTLGSDGRLTGLVERATGRQLLARPYPFVGIERADGTKADSVSTRDLGGGRFAFGLADGAGEAVVSMKTEKWGWVVTAESLTATNVAKFLFARVHPDPSKWIGIIVSARSDERSAVVLRALDFLTETSQQGIPCAFVRPDGPRPWKGARAGLAGGLRSRICGMMAGMIEQSGMARTKVGGPWSMAAEEARRGYVFATPNETTVDGWIDLCERTGIGIIHLSGWWKCLGHYPVDPAKYPGGFEEMKRVAARIHAAGLMAGTHSLTRGIGLNGDPSVTPVASPDLAYRARYTLARPLGKTDKVVYVAERPVDGHDLVGTFQSRGNYLRIDGEILQYVGIDRDSTPCAFTGVTRGRLGTRRTAHAQGVTCDYLLHDCGMFFPAADTPLADEIASAIAGIYNGCGLDELYFDGSGVGGPDSHYANAAFMEKVVSLLDQSKHPALCEASTYEPSAWWYRARIGALDHTIWGMKSFSDYNLRGALNLSRDSNFLSPQGGWWCPRLSDDLARGHFLDDAEFFAAKTAAHDISPALQPPEGPRPGRPLPVHLEDMLTVLGWYERPRFARAFVPEFAAAVRPHRAEVRLRQGADGIWRFRPVTVRPHRSGLASERAWTDAFASAGPATVRVEALRDVDASRPGRTVFSATNEIATTAAKGVEASVRKLTDKAHGNVLFLQATNRSARRNASWARAMATYPLPYLDGRHAQYGVWVRGDGSGALLNIQLRMGKEYFGSRSSHHVRLDFTGWQFVTIDYRERDAEADFAYEWPYPTISYDSCRYWFNPCVIAEACVFLNDIEPGKTAKAAVSDIVAMPATVRTLEQAKVFVNGRAFALPFPLESGEFAELEDGAWTRYSARGDRLQRVAATDAPRLVAGTNSFAFAAAGDAFRAEVTVIGLGEEKPAYGPLTDAMKREMSYEAMRPMTFAPSKGFDALPPVVTRPGETARLDVSLVGPIADPVLEVRTADGVKTLAFPTLAAGEVRRVKDGPVVSGSCAVTLKSSDARGADARLSLVKRYLVK